jgi:hypothetical protein
VRRRRLTTARSPRRRVRAVPARPPLLRHAGARFTSKSAAGVDSKLCAVLGSQWGDEGKGKLADILAKK